MELKCGDDDDDEGAASAPSVPGWVVQPLSDEPDWIRLCQRVTELLRVTGNPQWATVTGDPLDQAS